MTRTRPRAVVVGAGPTGLVCSALLSAFGVSVRLLEKRPTLPSHPQAHFINHRTMEILRPLHGLSQEVMRQTPPLREWRHFVYCESVRSSWRKAVDHFAGQESCMAPFSPEPVAHLSQNRLLPMLLERVRKRENVRVEFCMDVLECSSTKNGAFVRGQDETREWRIDADAVVVANGANSDLARKLGFSFEAPGFDSGLVKKGEEVMQSLVSVHFHSRRLAEEIAVKPAMLYFVFNAEVVMVLVVHNLQEGEFVAQVPFFPPLQKSSDLDRDGCIRSIEAAAGARLGDIQVSHALPYATIKRSAQIESIGPWAMKTQVAETFRRGNVFLVGDAAHVFPPAGGFGMNTGIQDAHNLAWKLAATLTGRSSKTLLDTYTAERRPIVMQNALLSIENWKEAAAVPSALGLNPSSAKLFSDFISGPVAKLFPESLSKALLETGLDFGRRVSAVDSPLKAWRQRKVEELFATGRSLRLQFPAEDLGFVYPSQPDRRTPSLKGTQVDLKRSSELFVQQLVVGGRLPHSILRLPASGQRVSSLDLVAFSKLSCTVFLTGIDKDECLALLRPNASDSGLRDLTVVLLTNDEGMESGRYQNSQDNYIPFYQPLQTDPHQDLHLAEGVTIQEAVDEDKVLTGWLTQCSQSCAAVVRPDSHVSSILPQPTATTLLKAVRSAFAVS